MSDSMMPQYKDRGEASADFHSKEWGGRWSLCWLPLPKPSVCSAMPSLMFPLRFQWAAESPPPDLFTCVHMFVYMCVHVCPRVCVRGCIPEVLVGCLPQLFFPLFLRLGLTCSGGLAPEWATRMLLAPYTPSVGDRDKLCRVWPLLQCGDLNSGPQACTDQTAFQSPKPMLYLSFKLMER